MFIIFFLPRSDMKSVSLVLAHANHEEVNTPVSPRDGRTPLHLASSIGNLAMAQILIWVGFILAAEQFFFSFFLKSVGGI